jgi:hypothetical protein
MEAKDKDPKVMLDRAIDVVRSSEPDQADMQNRAARVWARIGQELSRDGSIAPSASAVEQLRGCDDYRALIPDYIAGRLPAARALLFKDHTHECVACRNALNAARSEKTGGHRPPVQRARRLFKPVPVFVGIAAVLVVGIVLLQTGYLNFLLPVVRVNAMARSIDGKLYRVAELATTPVAAGESLKAGEPVRTSAGSRAVLELADGTRVEMRERSQVSLVGTHDGVRINLDRGSVIVEAAKQRNGHLYVGTNDCTVSVVGTVFAVSTGVKGSRVSVLEGEVHVAQATQAEQAIYPGQQITTTQALTATPIQDEISWSGNIDTHLAMLRALADVNAFLHDRVPGPQLRYQSSLLSLVPENTVVYGAFPNLSSTLGQAYDLFHQKITQNASLSKWWATANQQRSSSDLTLEELIGHIRNLGDQLGSEVVIAVTGSGNGPQDIMVLADARNPSGVLQEITTLAQRTSQQSPMRVLTNPAQLATFNADDRGPVAFVGNSLLVLASSPKAVSQVVSAQIAHTSGFASRPFYTSIQQAYSQGAGVLFAVDLASVFSGQPSGPARMTGLGGTDRLVVEQKQVAGKTITKAQLSFTGARTGMAAWLASPASMGALEFVSPQAYGLGSVVTQDAGTILREFLNYTSAGELRIDNNLEQFQSETGIDLQGDFAETLGGEFLFAMDGPFLPTPSWKVVVEVYNSARLQNTIERLINQANAHVATTNASTYTISSESVGGQIYYRVHPATGTGPEFDYTFALGYMVAAPSRALVSQALQYQQSRSSIANSAKFRSMIAADGNDFCSAILYQDLTQAASSIASYVPSAVGGITTQQLQTLRQTVELTPPTLVCATGESNRIVMGYQGDLGFNVLMLGGLRDVMQVIGGARN